MARRLLLERVMAQTKKQRHSKEQKLLDAVTHAASCLKEAGEPLHGLGPSARYASAFDLYGHALRDLLAHECPLHVADWSWDGYEGNFHFYWEFGTQLAQPGAAYEHDTRFTAMRSAARLDPAKPLLEELARLRAEASHYEELRNAVVRWASDARVTARVAARARQSLATTPAPAEECAS